jgi:hypothetical protein
MLVLGCSYMGKSVLNPYNQTLLFFVLVFYVGYILDDKNTLCNGCYLNRIIGLFQNLQSFMNNVYFKPCALS